MLFMLLEDRSRMLKGVIATHIIVCATLVIPSRLIIITRRLIKTGEQPIGKPVFFTHNKRCVRMRAHIIVVIQRIFEGVPDKTTEERNV